MTVSKTSWDTFNGLKVLRVHSHPIMSSGVWNDWYYDTPEMEEGFRSTDWNDPNNLNLFYDHEDTSAKNWIGKIDKPFYKDGTIFADLLVSNGEAQKAILMGAKFGISPKILGKGVDGSVKNFLFKNWSLVTEPACKTTFLNSQKVEDNGVYLTPNKFYILSHTGELMEAEKTEQIEVKETANVSKEELSEMVSKAVTAEVQKLKDTEEEEKKKKMKMPPHEMPEDMTQKNEEKSEITGKLDSDEEDIKYEKLFDRLMKMGILNSEYSSFVEGFKKEHPEAKLSEIADAWKEELREKDIAKLVEQKLAEREKGERMSMKTSTPQVPAFEDADVGMLTFLRDAYSQGTPAELLLTLSMEPKMDPFGRRIFELATTATQESHSRGTQFSAAGYPLQPIMYLRKAIDAAKERMRFMQVVNQLTMPDGTKEMVVPFRTAYLGRSSWETSEDEYEAAEDIAWTAINTEDGVLVTPTRENYGVALTNEAIRKNALQLVQYAREELSYRYEDVTDTGIRDQLLGTSTSGTATLGATEMSDTVRGCQTIYGGDATDADNSVDAGDTLTTALIAKARRMLMSTRAYYWSGNASTLSSTAKNAWEPTPSEPFVFFIAPEQEEALQTDNSQFTNAAEYGGQEPLLTGEIGRFLGVKIVSTTKTPAIASSDNILAQTAQQSFDVAGHLCGMVKAGKCGVFVWGQKPEIRVFDYPSADQVRMKLSLDYAAKPVYSDAIIRVAVADA